MNKKREATSSDLEKLTELDQAYDNSKTALQASKDRINYLKEQIYLLKIELENEEAAMHELAFKKNQALREVRAFEDEIR